MKSCCKTDRFLFGQRRKTCFVVAVLQHRLCYKTSCVAKPHVLIIAYPLHNILIGSLSISKILWPEEPDCSARVHESEVVLQNRSSFFLVVLQNLLCCSGVTAPAVLQNQLCDETTCTANFMPTTLYVDRQLVEFQNSLAEKT